MAETIVPIDLRAHKPTTATTKASRKMVRTMASSLSFIAAVADGGRPRSKDELELKSES